MQLFTVGDSISQGFMSGAAARTDLTYSSILAKLLASKAPNADKAVPYHHPIWEAGGLPLNLERIMRRLNRRYGNDISGFEWLTVLQTINDVLDEAEDYYERGPGAAGMPYPGRVPFFHNVSVRGFSVADSWQMTPEQCLSLIRTSSRGGDQLLSGPDEPLARTALRVLNPSLDPQHMGKSQLDWLDHHAQGEGIENLIVWLGSNNALGTIVSMCVNQTPGPLGTRSSSFSSIDHAERARARWNLWHPSDFADDYKVLADRIQTAMANNRHKDWRVFIGNVPQVTIAPLAKGVGEEFEVSVKIGKTTVPQIYYKYYTYFPWTEQIAHDLDIHLNLQQAILIDRCILDYNATIEKAIASLNDGADKPRYFLVDIAKMLRDMAFKRNRGAPPYQFPDVFAFLSPQVNTKYYHADSRGMLKQGGLFSLDGIHPTPIAHGLMALEFLKVMKAAGRPVDPNAIAGSNITAKAFWRDVFYADELYSRPISLMQEVYRHNKLTVEIIKLIRRFMPDNPATKALDS